MEVHSLDLNSPQNARDDGRCPACHRRHSYSNGFCNECLCWAPDGAWSLAIDGRSSRNLWRQRGAVLLLALAAAAVALLSHGR